MDDVGGLEESWSAALSWDSSADTRMVTMSNRVFCVVA
jgi:hypothetical protein